MYGVNKAEGCLPLLQTIQNAQVCAYVHIYIHRERETAKIKGTLWGNLGKRYSRVGLYSCNFKLETIPKKLEERRKKEERQAGPRGSLQDAGGRHQPML